MNQQSLQDIEYRDYTTPYLLSLSTGIEVIDKTVLMDNLVSTLMKMSSIKFYPSLFHLIETDISSYYSHFEIKNETLPIEKSPEATTPEPLSEEDILYEMIEHDFVAKIPPKKKYKIQVVVNNIKKGEPKTIMPNDLLAID